jgi:hypothetical protein
LEEAIAAFGNAAAGVIPVIAFSANAGIDDMMFHLAYDTTPHTIEREFIQSMIPDERATIQRGRRLNIDATRSLMAAIENHSEKKRIGRAIGQYALALRVWRWGYETLATAHLYMGMEALSKAVVRVEQQDRADEDFATSIGIDPKSLHQCDRLSTIIEATIRREILFKGDTETYKNAKRASDGFEHGFMPFDEIRALARSIRDTTAKYLRIGVMDLLNLDQRIRSLLLNAPYDVPLGCWPVVKYMRGQLVGESDQLAKGSNEYPILAWRSTIKDLELTDKGEYQVRFDESVTPLVGEGISFRAGSFEVWAP